MVYLSRTVFLSILVSLPALPAVAQTLSEAEIIELATQQGTCGERAVLSGRYDDQSRIVVTCGEATGFVPAIGFAGIGAGGAAAIAGGIGLIAAAGGGGGGSTPSTDQ